MLSPLRHKPIGPKAIRCHKKEEATKEDNMFRKTGLVTALAALMAFGGGATAQETTLRIQTHYAPETVSGKLAAQYVDDVQTMSNGGIKIEMFYSSSVVKSVETFDAAATGILDCDMTGGGYQTGKNPAFQFVGDIMGGYDTPYQQGSMARNRWPRRNRSAASPISRTGSSARLRAWRPRSSPIWAPVRS
jgi:hypothetical protein